MSLAANEPTTTPDALAAVIVESQRALGVAVSSLRYPVEPGYAAAIAETELAWREVESEFGMLSPADVSALLRSRGRPGSIANDQRTAGKLIGVRRGRQYQYPGFQFDRISRRVLPGMDEILAAARRTQTPADDLVIWLCSPTGQLGGDRPVDHLDNPHRVATAVENHFGTEW